MRGGIPRDWDGMNSQIKIGDGAFFMTRICFNLAYGEDD